ncbi:MAG: FecR domain-containing protein [Gammaproteobacteria bacterium]|nr:FecR domain-containing protein [Gammaproteobacteria bacterium]
MKDQAKKSPSDDQNLARLLKLAGPRPAPSADVRKEVYQAAHQAWQKKSRSTVLIRRLVPAAIAASIIGMAVVINWPATQAPVMAAPVAELDRGSLQLEAGEGWRQLDGGGVIAAHGLLRTGSQQRAGIFLRNGISVRLDRQTRLRLESPLRLALIEGRVYIDTVDYIGPSLEVLTGNAVVRDIGTQFEVRVDGGGTLVRVRDGEILLDSLDEQFSAGRGEQIALQDNGVVTRALVSGHDASWNWMHGIAPLFNTDGRLVSELVAWVGRETGRRIEYADSLIRNTAASTYIRGSVSGRTPVETLDLALETTRFKYYIDDEILAIEKHAAVGD